MEKIPVKHLHSATREPDFSAGFNIREVSSLFSGEDMIQELHRHSFYYVLFIEKGSGEHKIDFSPYPVGNNCVFVMRPGQVHHLLLQKGSIGFMMGFTGEFYAPTEPSAVRILKKVSGKNYCRLSEKRFARLQALLEIIKEEYTERNIHHKDAIRQTLSLFFLELSRQSSNPGELPAGNNNFMQERLEDLQELIEKNAASQKQVSFYANALHVTTHQLNTVTKSLLGKTCSELITAHILLEAKRYLLATAQQVNQIADTLGYEDVSYFIRFFKKHTGYSPEAFRVQFK